MEHDSEVKGSNLPRFTFLRYNNFLIWRGLHPPGPSSPPSLLTSHQPNHQPSEVKVIHVKVTDVKMAEVKVIFWSTLLRSRSFRLRSIMPWSQRSIQNLQSYWKRLESTYCRSLSRINNYLDSSDYSDNRNNRKVTKKNLTKNSKINKKY